MAAVSFEETEGRLVLEIVVVVALLMSKSPVLVRLVAVGLVVVEVAGVVVVVSMAGVALLGVHLVFGVAQVAVVVHASLRVAFFCYDAVVPCVTHVIGVVITWVEVSRDFVWALSVVA